VLGRVWVDKRAWMQALWLELRGNDPSNSGEDSDRLASLLLAKLPC